MPSLALSFEHRYQPATRPGLRPLLLLHGTGGDEADLLPLGELVSPGAALLSPRGQVLEGGMPRFFRRLAEGVFDEADVRRRAGDLAGFIEQARHAYGIAAPVALGYSNGANIAAAVLMLHPGVLAGAALLRAMVPLSTPPAFRLDRTPVLILSGAADPIVPARNAARLAAMLSQAGADLRHETLRTGHGLTQDDVVRAAAWLQAQPQPAA